MSCSLAVRGSSNHSVLKTIGNSSTLLPIGYCLFLLQIGVEELKVLLLPDDGVLRLCDPVTLVLKE